MVNYKYADLFNRDKAGAKVQIAFDGGVIENENIPLEKMEITESLCSGSTLQFGCCEASAFKIRIMNNVIPLIGKKLTISETLKDGEDEPFVFGTYKVYSDKPTADRRYRDIIAYDAMYDILHAEVAAWYNSLAFPMALKAFRDSFFAYMDIEQVAADLPNDSMIVEETIQPSELSGQTVIEAICEINGCFGHINRKGKFQYVFLQEMVQGVYPSNDLYPSDNLYPADGSSKQIDGSLYTSCSYEDYTCRRISKLQIRQEENDIGAIAGTGDNCYIMEDNFLVYGMGAEDLCRVAENLLPVLTKVSYRPFSAEAKGNPCIEVGDQVQLHTRYEIVESYVLQRTLKGIQALKDSYTAEGEETCTENVNSVNRSIVQLRGKTNILTRTVEETRLEIRDIEKGLSSRIQQTAEQIQTEVLRATEEEGELSSKITQTADSISAEVTRAINSEVELAAVISVTAEEITHKVSIGNVSSEISQEAGSISIKSNRFSLESTNCTISANGTITASNVDLTGKITANSGKIGGFTIGSSSIYNGKNSLIATSNGVYIGTDGISLGSGSKFKVTKEGVLTASDAEITGKVTASSGKIGGFTLSDACLYNGKSSLSSTSQGVYLGTDGISLGSGSAFKVTSAGALTASNVSITGGSIKIGSAELSSTQLSFGNTVIDQYGIAIRGSNWFNTLTFTGDSSAGYLKIGSRTSSTNVLKFTSGKLEIPISRLSLGGSSGTVGFFGSTGATKKSVTNVTSQTIAAVYAKINELLVALRAYNLIS